MRELLELWQIRDYIGISDLRTLNRRVLRKLGMVTAISYKNKPLAVIIPYHAYMTVQRLYREAQEAIERAAEARAQGMREAAEIARSYKSVSICPETIATAIKRAAGEKVKCPK